MMVRPEAISASSAPEASPLKSCEKKFGQVIIGLDAPAALRRPAPALSRVVAEAAAEGVRLLHQRKAGDDFGHLPEVLRVLHLLGRLALDDDDRADQLVIGGAPIDLADDRVDLAPGLVRLDDVRGIE